MLSSKGGMNDSKASMRSTRSFSQTKRKQREDFATDEQYYNYCQKYVREESHRRNMFVNNRVKEQMCPFSKS